MGQLSIDGGFMNYARFLTLLMACRFVINLRLSDARAAERGEWGPDFNKGGL